MKVEDGYESSELDQSELDREWTSRVRRSLTGKLPPDKLLPDTQPEYVASWIYVFGVLTISALVIVSLSGAILALEGPSWWHHSPEGHFVNSLHLWSVEFFFLFMVVHLWGKFFMAAWRGKRALTWITGVLAFVLSVGAAFTGYLSQQNFSSQWISTQAKDGLNSTGIGAFFNVLNFGQMFMWHILLLPLLVVFAVGIHVLLVRYRGVVPPIEASSVPVDYAKPWKGRVRAYDILKEATIGLFVVAILTIGFSAVFSSPDEPAVTLKQWAQVAPVDFVQTAATELAGTSEAATYGPPYNNGTAVVQSLGPVSLQKLAGVRIKVNPATDFVLQPLSTISDYTPGLAPALLRYQHASSAQQTSWNAAFARADAKLTIVSGDRLVLSAGHYGPVPTLMSDLLAMARSGGLDGALEGPQQFYGTNYTKPLLFLADGGYLTSIGQHYHLLGNEWGMTNETGNYPGQAWLWLYTFWYQVPPMSTSGNGDALVMAVMGVLTLALALVPFIPGVRRIPEKIPIYRIIWRSYYRRHQPK
ncbi:MAG: cytochrome b N-terminal domain-containing protein [Ferrimicrobium sp.]